MVNPHRGEIEAELGGRTRRLCLTLGALAELEARFAAADIVALAERFESGRLKSADAIAIIAAGLRGAGEDVSEDDVAAMTTPMAAAGFVDTVARLLEATFASGDRR